MPRDYDPPLQFGGRPDQRERIIAISEREGISQAEVMRQLVDLSLKRRETMSLARYPEQMELDV